MYVICKYMYTVVEHTPEIPGQLLCAWNYEDENCEVKGLPLPRVEQLVGAVGELSQLCVEDYCCHYPRGGPVNANAHKVV